MQLAHLANNGYILIILAGLWILVGMSIHVSRGTIQMTRLVILLLLLNSALINLELWTQQAPTLSIWRPILTAAVYSLNPLILYFIIRIITPIERKLLFLMPVLLNAGVCISSIWTNVVVWFSQDNHFHGGPLRYLPYGVEGVYVLVFLLLSIQAFRKKDRREHGFIPFLVISGAATVMFILLAGGDTDYTGLLATELVLYYLFLYIQMAKSDPLTHLLNRQSYYRDLETYEKRFTGVISVDMNELKWINDTQGHDAGDRALATIAACLRERCNSDGSVYRVGGDEFMILYRGASAKQILSDLEDMRAGMEKTGYVCAFGVCLRQHPEDKIADMLVSADQAMYAEKARLKQAVLDSGGVLHGRDVPAAPEA